MEPFEHEIRKIRPYFPMLQRQMHGKPFIYLDSAATTHKPLAVIEAMSRFYSEEYATVHRSVYDFAAQATDHYQTVRNQVKQFLNAAFVEEIVFTKGTTDGINLIANSFLKAFAKPGDEVILSMMEHHSNLIPWQMVCAERGLTLKWIPMNAQGELELDEFERLLTDRTKIVSVAHIGNVTGTVNPIEKITQMAHSRGAKVLIDGAQSAAHVGVDVQKLGVDFYVFSGHKAYGPTGIGVLYGKKALLEKMPPYQGGGDMIEEVFFDRAVYQQAPLKFEAGTPPIAEVIGLGAALQFIESVGRDKIEAWELELLRYATQKMEEIPGLRILGTAPGKGGIISFQIEQLHPLDIGTLLDIRGIAIRTGNLCAQPTLRQLGVAQTARISFGVYNTHAEVDAFIQALKEVILLLRPTLSY
ncbi:MAG: cysteine desulfurase [Bacteroidetes bacterium]|nr:cysteine desulfurase [Bacteroidota bacterium]